MTPRIKGARRFPGLGFLPQTRRQLRAQVRASHATLAEVSGHNVDLTHQVDRLRAEREALRTTIRVAETNRLVLQDDLARSRTRVEQLAAQLNEKQERQTGHCGRRTRGELLAELEAFGLTLKPPADGGPGEVVADIVNPRPLDFDKLDAERRALGEAVQLQARQELLNGSGAVDQDTLGERIARGLDHQIPERPPETPALTKLDRGDW